MIQLFTSLIKEKTNKMPYIENKIKKLITYFIKECAQHLKKKHESQAQDSELKRNIYDTLTKLSKQKRTKKNLQILLFGQKEQLLKLFQAFKMKCSKVDWEYLQDTQQKIRHEIYFTYVEKEEELWEVYKKSHEEEDCSKMKKYIIHVIVEKRLEWEETGTRRMNMRRIQQSFSEQTNQETHDVTQNQSGSRDSLMEDISEEAQTEQKFHTINQQQQQFSAEISQWFQDPKLEIRNILNFLDEDQIMEQFIRPQA